MGFFTENDKQRLAREARMAGRAAQLEGYANEADARAIKMASKTLRGGRRARKSAIIADARRNQAQAARDRQRNR